LHNHVYIVAINRITPQLTASPQNQVPDELPTTLSQVEGVRAGSAMLVSAPGELQVLDEHIAPRVSTNIPVHDLTVLQHLPAATEFMAQDQYNHTSTVTQVPTAEGHFIPLPSLAPSSTSTPVPISTLTTSTRMFDFTYYLAKQLLIIDRDDYWPKHRRYLQFSKLFLRPCRPRCSRSTRAPWY